MADLGKVAEVALGQAGCGARARKPVIASDIPGNRDLVVDSSTGFLVEMGDRAAFAQKTEQLLNDPELSKRLGENARSRMESEFSISEMIQKHIEYYGQLLSS